MWGEAPTKAPPRKWSRARGGSLTGGRRIQFPSTSSQFPIVPGDVALLSFEDEDDVVVALIGAVMGLVSDATCVSTMCNTGYLTRGREISWFEVNLARFSWKENEDTTTDRSTVKKRFKPEYEIVNRTFEARFKASILLSMSFSRSTNNPLLPRGDVRFGQSWSRETFQKKTKRAQCRVYFHFSLSVLAASILQYHFSFFRFHWYSHRRIILSLCFPPRNCSHHSLPSS